jgi:hypothetical protein
MPDQSPANAQVDASLTAEVLKVDVEKRLVWGWFSVIKEGGKPVVDSQGDVIEEPELVAAAHGFSKAYRHAKVMHQGEAIGDVVESVVLTEGLQAALGVDLGKVGWLGCMELPAEIVAKVESGELPMFSIGGRAIREEITDGD